MGTISTFSGRNVAAANSRAEQVRVVVCGSMTAMSLMRRLQTQLAAHGIEVVVPEIDDMLAPSASAEQIQARKREASLAHMAAIKQPETRAVLIANVDKNGKSNYVGPNAVAEIGVAVSEDRAVYLWGGLPDDLREEFDAWRVRCLHGDLTSLLDKLAPRNPARRRPASRPSTDQETLFG